MWNLHVELLRSCFLHAFSRRSFLWTVQSYYGALFVPYTRACNFILGMYTFLPLARLFLSGATFFAGATYFRWRDFFSLALICRPRLDLLQAQVTNTCSCAQDSWLDSGILPIVLVKKALNAKAVLVFCPKSVKIMLIFFKKKCSWVTSNAHFFGYFQSTKCNNCSSMTNVDDAIMERVWWTGI